MDISVLITFIAVFVLILLSAFFSGSETALTAASRVRLHAQAKAGNKRASLVNKIREKKDRLIGALLLGNNLVNILASALTTSVMIQLFDEAGVVYATLVMTMLILVFAEVLPKTYALHHADSMSMRIAPIIRVVVLVFAPVTETVTWIVRSCLKLFGIDISKVGAGSHLELLRGTIEMHHGKGQKTQDQRAMLRSILDLFDVDVEEVMIHRKNVIMINAEIPMQDLINEVLNAPYTRIPVYREDQDNIIGIVHVKALVRELMNQNGNPAKVDLEKIISNPWFIPETTNLYDQLQAFRERKEHFAIVIDEYGTFMGIVTLEDILEEIVGEIDDEHDHSVPGVRKLHDGTYLVDGAVTIRDLNREFEWNLPDGDYATLAGMILNEAQMIPEVGQSFIFHNFQFDISKRQRNQITLVRITPPAKKLAV